MAKASTYYSLLHVTGTTYLFSYKAIEELK